MRLLPVLALFLPAAAPAQGIDPARIAAVVTADWTGEGSRDRALLVETEEGADLWILENLDEGRRPPLVARNLVWRGAAWGTEPSLALSPQGSLLVIAQNDAIGRSRWRTTLTLAFRGGRLVVAGYTAEARDTLDLSESTCDVNLLTGRGTLDGRPIRTALRAIPATDWTAETSVPECTPR